MQLRKAIFNYWVSCDPGFAVTSCARKEICRILRLNDRCISAELALWLHERRSTL